MGPRMREDNGWGTLGMDSRPPRLHGGRLFAGIAEGVRDGRDWMFRLHMGLVSLRFLGPPLGKGADKDELDVGWKKMFQEIEAG